MKRLFLFVLLLAALGLTSAQDASGTPPEGTFVIQNVTIFDGNEVQEGMSVLVEEGEIVEVSASIEAPAGAAIVNGTGKTLMPGMIDSHVHTFFPEALQQNLIFGVTAVLDQFTDTSFAQFMRMGQPATDRADFFSAGTLATAPDGHGTQFGLSIPTLTGPEQAQQWVADRVAEGSEWIKIIIEDGEELGMETPTLDEETVRALVDAAKEQGKLVVTHVQTLEAAKQAIEAGTDGLAHIFIDAMPDEEFLQMAVDAGIFVIPTLAVFESIGEQQPQAAILGDERLAPYLSATDIQNLTMPFSGYENLSIDFGRDAVRRLHEAGIPILAGTDAMNPGVVYGASMHRELELLVEAGLTPAEALAAATSVPAEIFDIGNRGVVTEGALADLVLVDGKPHEEILDSRNIETVWKAGVPVDRAGYLAGLEAQRSAVQEQAQALATGETVLVSDFESGEATVGTGQPWEATTDVQAGGDSVAAIEVVEGGAGDSSYALEVSGTVGGAFMLPWAGAMYMPGAFPFAPADFSAVPVLAFDARSDEPGQYRVQIFCENVGQVPPEWQFETGSEWQEYSVDLSELGCDTGGLMSVIFSASQPGEFQFQLDNVRFEPAE